MVMNYRFRRFRFNVRKYPFSAILSLKKLPGLILLALGVFAAQPLWAGAALPNWVQVQLFEAYPGIQAFQIQGRLQLTQPVQRTLKGDLFTLHQHGNQLELRQGKSTGVLLKSTRLSLKAAHAGSTLRLTPLTPPVVKGRQYSGLLTFQSGGGQLSVINRVAARDYVAVVISSETPPNWPQEALKAQAVLTQSRLARYQPGDLLGDSTQREAYLGDAYLKSKARRMVSEVWGQTLTYQKRPVTPYYHASCGGHTSGGEYLGGEGAATPWLSAIACHYCVLSPFTKPTVSVLSQNSFQKAFPGSFPMVTQRDGGGRPLRVRQGKNKKVISGYQFWIRMGQQLGWDKAPGTRLSLTRLADGKVQVSSTGAGHGVGLCQWGAAGMASQGKTYRDILKFYFPKAKLSEGNPF
jgi:stage II sporulation protein D